DGGIYYDVEVAYRHGMQMVDEGVDFIDVGGESSRPGSDPVPIEEEIRRVLPVIERLAKAMSVPISIDTYKHEVAARALDAGAVIVNDISGLHFDTEVANVTAKHSATIVLMHTNGPPKTMQQDISYNNLIDDVADYLSEGISRARNAGIQQIIVDPGIGFGKTVDHNLQLLKHLGNFRRFGLPILVGPSRKSFLGPLLNLPVTERLEGTAGAVAASILNGANIVRVHDVKEMRRVATVVDAIHRA
ncbi:MAG TPA: dihydropteroate synthase, partial [Bacteroidota bacterium]|nr:dihydropteroate synthase [Bacteroidota bacterium]